MVYCICPQTVTDPSINLVSHRVTCILLNQTATSKVKSSSRIKPSTRTHSWATGRHLPYGITQCYLPPDTSECTLTCTKLTHTTVLALIECKLYWRRVERSCICERVDQRVGNFEQLTRQALMTSYLLPDTSERAPSCTTHSTNRVQVILTACREKLYLWASRSTCRELWTTDTSSADDKSCLLANLHIHNTDSDTIRTHI